MVVNGGFRIVTIFLVALWKFSVRFLEHVLWSVPCKAQVHVAYLPLRLIWP